MSPTGDDNIVYDINPGTGKSKSGWGHPTCSDAATQIGENLPTTNPIGSITMAAR